MPEIDLPLTSGVGVATAGRASERTASIPETELATPKDRVAAQILDAAFCILLFWYGASAVVLHYGRIAIMVQHHEIRSTVGQLAIALFALTAGVYYFLMEWARGRKYRQAAVSAPRHIDRWGALRVRRRAALEPAAADQYLDELEF